MRNLAAVCISFVVSQRLYTHFIVKLHQDVVSSSQNWYATACSRTESLFYHGCDNLGVFQCLNVAIKF